MRACDLPAVPLDELARERQADSEAGRDPRRRRVGLRESFEDVRQELGIDAGTGVAHRDARQVVRFHDDVDRAVSRRELDRVGQQVPHDLPQAVGVAPDDQRPAAARYVQGHSLRRSRHCNLGDGLVHNRVERDRAHLKMQTARQRLRDVEQVTRELRLEPDVAFDRLEAARLRRCVEFARSNQVQPAEHGIERRAQLVRDGRQELVSRPVRRLRLGLRRLGQCRVALRVPPRPAHLADQRREQETLHDEERQVHLDRRRPRLPGRDRSQDNPEHSRGERGAGAREPRGADDGDPEQQEESAPVNHRVRRSVQHEHDGDGAQRGGVADWSRDRGKRDRCPAGGS